MVYDPFIYKIHTLKVAFESHHNSSFFNYKQTKFLQAFTFITCYYIIITLLLLHCYYIIITFITSYQHATSLFFSQIKWLSTEKVTRLVWILHSISFILFIPSIYLFIFAPYWPVMVIM